MNYLAHLHLADRAGADLAGAVLGDLVRGADLSMLPPPVERSVRLHRRIDATTDRHPLLAAARARWPAASRRYAPIVLDLLLDHLLALDWARHCTEPLPAFCARAAAAVSAAGALFVAHGGRQPDAAGFAALLQSYREAAGIDCALRRVAARMRRGQGLHEAAALWPAQAIELRPQLTQLMDDLTRAAHEFMRT